jgi:hypothetical protein
VTKSIARAWLLHEFQADSKQYRMVWVTDLVTDLVTRNTKMVLVLLFGIPSSGSETGDVMFF